MKLPRIHFFISVSEYKIYVKPPSDSHKTKNKYQTELNIFLGHSKKKSTPKKQLKPNILS